MFSWLPILKGKHETLSVSWYRHVGAQLILTLMLTMICNPLTRLCKAHVCCWVRCCDRGCRLDDKYTKKLTQADYENVNLGPTFEIDYRYNSVLTIVFVTMMYSGGLPVLYPIAALYFCITYWSDKYLLLK